MVPGRRKRRPSERWGVGLPKPERQATVGELSIAQKKRTSRV